VEREGLPMSKYIIQADKAALPPGQVAKRDRFLADAYDITIDVAQKNAAVTHSRNGAAGVTLRASANGRDYQAVRLFQADSADATLLGRLIDGVIVSAGGLVIRVTSLP
jgi:hypothetical protein